MNIALMRRHQRRPQRSGGLLALRFSIVALMGLFAGLLVSVLAGAGLAFGVYAAYVQDLPSAEEIGRLSTDTFETTRLYDRTGNTLLYELIPPDSGRRTWVPLSEISENLRNATIAIEDKTFYTNPGGINVEGIGRAAVGVLRGEDAGGGSSIHQQLVRDVIMTPEERMERSYIRKVKEAVLAMELTRRYPGMEGRDAILEWYLNRIFYGQLSYGIEAAAQTYFNKHASELDLAEAAMLAHLPNAPTLNPIDRPEDAKRRQEMVLDALALQGYITSEQAWDAKQQTLVIAPPRFDMQAPHFVLYVREQLEQRFGRAAVYGGGLKVITSVDLDIQNKVTEIAREHIATLRDAQEVTNAAVVVLDTKTSEILAMMGSLEYGNVGIDGSINMATSPRQPGSSFKPFTYATAFAHGYTPATVVLDKRTAFPDPPNPPYVPENYSRRYYGPVLMRQALACSYNIPAVAMMHKVGSDKVVELAHRMGINTLRAAHYGLSLTLGGGEVTLLDMTYAFSAFANNGTMLGEARPAELVEQGFRRLDPVSILKITDVKGATLYEYKAPHRQQVLSPEVAFLITDILADDRARIPGFGVDSALKLPDRPAAAKSGTTNNYHDGWTMGYTPQYSVGVWTGNTDYKPMKSIPGVRVAGPIWNRTMVYLHEGLPVENFSRPSGLVTAIVDSASGKLPTQYSRGRVQELFIEGTVPTERDDINRPFRICQVTGKLATPYCPPETVEEVVFQIFPPDAEDWMREEDIPRPPEEYCDEHGPNLTRVDVAITSPRALQVVSATVPIMGNAKAGGQSMYRLEVAPGMAPDGGNWQPIGPDHGERVDNNLLEYWDTQGQNGLFTLRLLVVDGGAVREATVPVLVDNTPPEIMLLNPEADTPERPAKVYEKVKDEWINIQAYAVDNTSLQRVEFFMNDEYLGYSTVAPYSYRWTITLSSTVGITETRTFRADAYDAAGNKASSEPVEVKMVYEKREPRQP